MSAEEKDVAAQLESLEGLTATAAPGTAGKDLRPATSGLGATRVPRPGPRLSPPGEGLWRPERGPQAGDCSRYAETVQMKGATVVSLARSKIKPGTRLVREWGGETHVVTATGSGL